MLCLSDYFALGYHLSCPILSRMNVRNSSVRSLNPSPTTVSRSRLFTRSNSFAPSSFSRLLIAAVIDGCEIWHTSDALVILPYLHVSRKYCKWFRFISVLSGRSPNPTTTLSLMTSICEIYTKSKQHNRAFLY